MNNATATLVWNSKTLVFGVASHELALAMLNVGNTEGYDRASQSPKAERVLIQQEGKKCRIAIFASNVTLSNITTRVEAKALAKQLKNFFGMACFNKKKSGEIVPF